MEKLGYLDEVTANKYSNSRPIFEELYLKHYNITPAYLQQLIQDSQATVLETYKKNSDHINILLTDAANSFLAKPGVNDFLDSKDNLSTFIRVNQELAKIMHGALIEKQTNEAEMLKKADEIMNQLPQDIKSAFETSRLVLIDKMKNHSTATSAINEGINYMKPTVSSTNRGRQTGGEALAAIVAVCASSAIGGMVVCIIANKKGCRLQADSCAIGTISVAALALLLTCLSGIGTLYCMLTVASGEMGYFKPFVDLADPTNWFSNDCEKNLTTSLSQNAGKSKRKSRKPKSKRKPNKTRKYRKRK
jgi:hypothetical protein